MDDVWIVSKLSHPKVAVIADITTKVICCVTVI